MKPRAERGLGLARPAVALSESTTSRGAHLVFTDEGLFCDKKSKILYPICNVDVAADVHCSISISEVETDEKVALETFRGIWYIVEVRRSFRKIQSCPEKRSESRRLIP
jgi:hypothetical protein